MVKRQVSAGKRVAGAFRRDDGGATAVEYAILLGLIAMVIIGSVALFGGNVKSLYGSVDASLSSVAP